MNVISLMPRNTVISFRKPSESLITYCLQKIKVKVDGFFCKKCFRFDFNILAMNKTKSKRTVLERVQKKRRKQKRRAERYKRRRQAQRNEL